MDQDKFVCPSHPHHKIQFFCTANQWHFVPLCSECLPSHTQKHPKGIKVNIENFQTVWQKHCSQKDNALKLYEQEQSKIHQQLKSQKIGKQFEQLEQYREKTIGLVNKYFDETKQKLEKKVKQTKQYQQQLLERLKKNVQADISDIKGLIEIENVQVWAQQAKRFYFKDNLSAYIDQIQQLLREHKQRVYERKDLSFKEIKKIQEDIKNILSSAISFDKEVQKIEKKDVQETKNVKKGPKIVNKPKLCKVCGGQMKYLTEWKKHLVCPTCGGKQRNYIPKQK